MRVTRRPPRERTGDRDVVDALDAIRRIIRVLRLSSRVAEREFGVSAAQVFVLQQLATAPASSINELAERTYTHQSSVSVVVRRLVEQKLVVRREGARDRRRRELQVTPAGRRLLARAPLPGQLRLIGGLRSLPLKDLRRLARLLARLVRGMGAAGEPATMLFEPGRSSHR